MIPIYRAKKINSEEYVDGQLLKNEETYYIIADDFYGHETECDEYYDDGSIFGTICLQDNIYKIDPSTLAIHFPDMITSDSDRLLPNGEKDLRIFASLSEDGKGGDIVLTHDRKDVAHYVQCMGKNGLRFSRTIKYIKTTKNIHTVIDLKVIGIQQ